MSYWSEKQLNGPAWNGEGYAEIGEIVSYNCKTEFREAKVIGRHECWLWLDVPGVGLVTVQQITGLVDPAAPRPAEPKPMDDNCLAAKIGEIGNQIHNLGCYLQNDEDLSDRLSDLAIALWGLAKDAPKELAAPEWDGEGLPPVGSVCEGLFVFGASRRWRRMEILRHREGDNSFAVYVPEIEALGWCKEVRPIKTQADRDREDLEEDLKGILPFCEYDGPDIRELAKILYAQGYRKP